MDEKPRGYIKLYRKQFQGDDAVWDDGTPFDSRSAWIWLLQFAAWKDSVYHTKFAADELKRGEFVASLRFLAERWKWSHTRVRRFLRLLGDPKVQRIALQRMGNHGSVYLIVKYDHYQSGLAPRDTDAVTPNVTQTIQSRNKVEEGKEGKANYPPEFEFIWNLYPRRAGGSAKGATYRLFASHLKTGVAYDLMVEGVRRYYAKMHAAGKMGTEFVMDAKTFFGRDKHFLDEHPIPTGDEPRLRVVSAGPKGSDIGW